MSMVIRSFNNLHDNRVLRYCADFEAHPLHMDTQTEAGENVSVRFTGLLAHRFEDVIQDNILFGMDEITVDGFFEQYNDLLGGTILYGFPACCSIEELRERMDREHIRVFVITHRSIIHRTIGPSLITLVSNGSGIGRNLLPTSRAM